MEKKEQAANNTESAVKRTITTIFLSFTIGLITNTSHAGFFGNTAHSRANCLTFVESVTWNARESHWWRVQSLHSYPKHGQHDKIMFCIDYGSHLDAIGLLEKYNVDVNKPDSNGSLFLNVAMCNNKIPMVTYLLKTGARPDVKDASGLSALEWVETPKMRQVFQEALEEADVEEQTFAATSMHF